eukprot:tig00020554_g10874.t1
MPFENFPSNFACCTPAVPQPGNDALRPKSSIGDYLDQHVRANSQVTADGARFLFSMRHTLRALYVSAKDTSRFQQQHESLYREWRAGEERAQQMATTNRWTSMICCQPFTGSLWRPTEPEAPASDDGMSDSMEVDGGTGIGMSLPDGPPQSTSGGQAEPTIKLPPDSLTPAGLLTVGHLTNLNILVIDSLRLDNANPFDSPVHTRYQACIRQLSNLTQLRTLCLGPSLPIPVAILRECLAPLASLQTLEFSAFGPDETRDVRRLTEALASMPSLTSIRVDPSRVPAPTYAMSKEIFQQLVNMNPNTPPGRMTARDADLLPLGQMGQLRRLCIPALVHGSGCSVQYLAGLPQLEELAVAVAKPDELDFAPLASLQGLLRLEVEATNSDDSMTAGNFPAAFSTLKCLRRVRLSCFWEGITGSIESFPPQLEVLRLGYVDGADAVLPRFAALRALRHLELFLTDRIPDDISAFRGLAHLKTLAIHTPAVQGSEDDVRRCMSDLEYIRSALPLTAVALNPPTEDAYI